jgi:hypothetical protein
MTKIMIMFGYGYDYDYDCLSERILWLNLIMIRLGLRLS